jgi:hypothetical protein
MKFRLQQRKDSERRPKPDRLEIIKERLNELLPTTEYKITDHKEESFKWASAYQDDVTHLLQRLERYETALKGIVDKQGNIRPDGEAWEYVGEFNESVKIAKEALKE